MTILTDSRFIVTVVPVDALRKSTNKPNLTTEEALRDYVLPSSGIEPDSYYLIDITAPEHKDVLKEVFEIAAEDAKTIGAKLEVVDEQQLIVRLITSGKSEREDAKASYHHVRLIYMKPEENEKN